MSKKTVYDIYVPIGRLSGTRVARYSDLDAAVEEVKRMQRQDPARAIRLEVIPTLDEAHDDDLGERLAASWWQRNGTSRGPNPFETLVQKRTDEHHATVEKAAEAALQGGQHGVRVDVYPTRTQALVDPAVPYGCRVEHQHSIDPLEER